MERCKGEFEGKRKVRPPMIPVKKPVFGPGGGFGRSGKGVRKAVHALKSVICANQAKSLTKAVAEAGARSCGEADFGL